MFSICRKERRAESIAECKAKSYREKENGIAKKKIKERK